MCCAEVLYGVGEARSSRPCAEALDAVDVDAARLALSCGWRRRLDLHRQAARERDAMSIPRERGTIGLDTLSPAQLVGGLRRAGPGAIDRGLSCPSRATRIPDPSARRT